MALTAYLSLTAEQQGRIKGSVTRKGREGCIAVLEANHEVLRVIDGVDGRPTGQREHRPFVVVKEIDQATPALYQALVNSEPFSSFVLDFVVPASNAKPAGALITRYTVRLHHAVLNSIRFVHPDVLDDALKTFPEAEELSFVYERIEWHWHDPERSAGDTTDAPPGERRRRADPLE